MSGFGSSRARAERLVQLTSALGGGRPISLSELRDGFGLYAEGDSEASRRQFERDKASLRENGVVIETVDTGEVALYWIRSRRTPVTLTEIELDALAVLAATVGDPATGVSLAAFAGAAGQFPADHSPGKVSVDNLAIPDAVTQALAEDRQLEVTYRNADGEASERTIEPWELRHRGGLTYVVGYDLRHGEKRNFRLDRFVGDCRLGAPAEHPRPDGPTGPVHPDDRFDFELDVPAGLRSEIADLGGHVTSGPSGHLRGALEAMRPETVLGWSLRHGARITAPPQWAAEQQARLQRIIAVHRGAASEVAHPKPTKVRAQHLSVERLRRLMVLPRFLGELKGVTREELAGYLGCSLQELAAELELLDNVELPGHGPIGEVEEVGGQLVYHRHLLDPTIHMSPADALRLLFLVEMVRPILSDEAEGLEAIAARLRTIVPAVVQIDLAGARHPDLEVIKQAIAERDVIRFEYQGRKDPVRRDRQIAPTQFRVAHGAIYLAGIDVVLGEERQFRLDRMGPVEVAGQVPSVPTDSTAPTYVPTEPEVDAVMLLGIRGTWLLAQLGPSAVEHRDDGTVVALVRTDAVEWLLSHVMAAGGEAEIVAPDDLRERLVARASAMAEDH